jgi:uncharacterized protein involved in cysteine biosynthesis
MNIYERNFYKKQFKILIVPLLIAFVILISTSKLFFNLIIKKLPEVAFMYTDYIKLVCITFILTILLVQLVIIRCANKLYKQEQTQGVKR